MDIVEWTLGAVLYEDELAAIKECETPTTKNSATRLPYSAARWIIMLSALFTFHWIGHLNRN